MPLNTDEPNRAVTMPDGRVVRNLTDDEYAATYAEGTPCNAGLIDWLRANHPEIDQ